VGLTVAGGSRIPALDPVLLRRPAPRSVGRPPVAAVVDGVRQHLAAGNRAFFYGTAFAAAPGAAVPAATWTAASSLALDLGSGALGGALLGPALAPCLRQHRADEAVYADQRWSREYEPGA
jgi:hypothetical protein